MNVLPIKTDRQIEVVFIMDGYSSLNMETETSLLLIETLIERGVSVYWAEQRDLILLQDQLHILVRKVQTVQPFELGETYEVPAGKFDAIVVRPDPPFDENYLHLTYLLDFVPEHVKQFNRPEALRNLNEKLIPLQWPHLTPATLTTQNTDALMAFLNVHKDIVIKPLGDCSGRGILRLQEGGKDLSALLAFATRNPSSGANRYVTAQAFIPGVKHGDKRIFIAGGEIVGWVNRVPAENGFLGNIHQGAVCLPSDLTEEEINAVEEMTPFLSEHGILMAGADFIDGKLTELNITSPSAIRQINAVSGKQVHQQIVDAMLFAIKHQEVGVSEIGNPSLGRGVGSN